MILSANILSAQTVTHTIHEVQGELFNSPLVDQTVTVQGVVTATSDFGYFIQDGAGAWNGVFVYDNTNLPIMGDDVVVQAEVAEYFDNTELLNLTYFEILSSGNALPEATTLGTGFISATGEPYEGSLVEISGATCTIVGDEFGQGYFDDGSGACAIDDMIYTSDPAFELNGYYVITGPLNYNYEEYKIEPRSSLDVVIIMGFSEIIDIQDLLLYPNPTVEELNFYLNEKAVANFYDLNGRLVVVEELNAGNARLDVSGFYPGTYHLECVSKNKTYRASFVKK